MAALDAQPSAISAYSAIFSAHVEDNLSPTCAHPYTFIYYPHASLTEVYKPFIHPTFILPFLTPGHYYPTPCYRLQVYNLYTSMHNIRVIIHNNGEARQRKRGMRRKTEEEGKETQDRGRGD